MGRQSSIDVFRLLAAFAVVVLHVNMGDISYDKTLHIRLLARFAVPFFFIASGYFFYHSYQASGDKALIKSLVKLFGIYVVSSLIYLPKAIMQDTLRIDDSIVLRGTGTHLWFLPSLMFGLFVVWYVVSYLKSYWLLLIILLVFIAPVYLYYYSDGSLGRLMIDVDFTRFITSAGFLSIGMLIARFKINCRTLTSTLILLSGIVILFVEMSMLKRFGNAHIYDIQFSLSGIVIALGLFFLSFKAFNNTYIGNIGNEMSLGIYLYHPLINTILFNLIIRLAGSYSGFVLMFNPLICFFGTLVFLMTLKKIYPKLFAVLNGDLSQFTMKKTT